MGIRASRSESAPQDLRAGSAPEDVAVEVVFFHDVLCAWSYIADQRLQVLRAHYGQALTWRTVGFALRTDNQAPDKKQRALFARHFKRAAKEVEGQGVVADLWTEGDAPLSSLPPLLALEAARAQGEGAHDALKLALRQAAFLRGLNVARRDVLVELAQGAGLDVARFIACLDDPHTEELLLSGMHEAEDLDLRGVPAILVGDEWLLQGCREVSAYREVLDRYLAERGGGGPEPRVIH